MGLVETLRGLSDAELLSSLGRVVATGRRATAELLAHLTEVELRRLHLEASCPSLFAYCTERLGLDEGAAYTRIRAARVARRFPVVLRMVADGRLHLAGIGLLAGHLTEDNHRELLAQASGRSKRAIEALLAERAPKPEVPATIRRLPGTESAAAQQRALDLRAAVESRETAGPAAESVAPSPAGPALAGEPSAAPPGAAVVPSERQGATSAGVPGASSERQAATSAAPVAPSERQGAASAVVPSAVEVAPVQELTRDRWPAASGQARAPSDARAAQRRRGVVEPLGAHRHRIELTASDALVGKLERARALLSHKLPGSDIADVIEEALELLVETLEKKRYGARRKRGGAEPRRSTERRTEARVERRRKETGPRAAKQAPPGATDPGSARDAGGEALPEQPVAAESTGHCGDRESARRQVVDVAPTPVAPPEHAGAEPDAKGAAPTVPGASNPSGRGPRRVPMGVRREVYERDGARCTHVDAEGRRCKETRNLELDHIEPWARGGPSTAENLRLLCAPHNRHEARKEFGPAFIARSIERRASGPPG